MQNALQRLEFPELFIGIVSPVGVETKSTIESISEFFTNNDYEVFQIKVTDYFHNIKKGLLIDLELDAKNTENRIKSYIEFGNRIRSEFNDNSILASYTIFRIMKLREREIQKKNNISYQKRVYILHQFKRKEEIDLLRQIYGRLFFQISVYSRKESRIDYLSHKLAHERNTADQSETRPIASTLVARDENEKHNKNGQRVTKIFHDADLIVNIDLVDRNSVKQQIDRFFELIFSSNEISPTKQEYGMFAAKAAALRTLDLSRQVGAAIFHETGEIISMGSNEVPKANGGTYWCDEPPHDAREFVQEKDSNDARKKEILHEIYQSLGINISFEEFLKKDSIKESQFMDALEYGRIVHAEMSAISDAARLGLPLKDATLYCTTFPCHMCAKHIVASGIKRVVFLEPYPKSLASDLHSDSIQVEGANRGRFEAYPSVKFEHFYGITPRRYRENFERNSRKDNGIFQKYIGGRKRPNLNLIAPFYAELEQKVVSEGLIAYRELRAKRLEELSAVRTTP